MTDPRAALADDLGHDLWYLQDKANRRGVLLVTEERLATAIVRVMRPADAVNAAAIFAALSADD